MGCRLNNVGDDGMLISADSFQRGTSRVHILSEILLLRIRSRLHIQILLLTSLLVL